MNEGSKSNAEASSRWPGLGLVDAVGMASQWAGQWAGFLSDGAERVEVLNVVGQTRLRVSDRSDEGWPPIEIALPGSFEFELCNASVLTRTVYLTAQVPRSQVVAEFEALGLGCGGAREFRRTERRTRWVREIAKDTLLHVIADEDGRSFASIFQRRSEEALKAAVRRRADRNSFSE